MIVEVFPVPKRLACSGSDSRASQEGFKDELTWRSEDNIRRWEAGAINDMLDGFLLFSVVLNLLVHPLEILPGSFIWFFFIFIDEVLQIIGQKLDLSDIDGLMCDAIANSIGLELDVVTSFWVNLQAAFLSTLSATFISKLEQDQVAEDVSDLSHRAMIGDFF